MEALKPKIRGLCLIQKYVKRTGADSSEVIVTGLESDLY